MEEKKWVKINATLVASFPRGQWEDEVEFDVTLVVKCDNREKLSSREILEAFFEKVGLCAVNNKVPYLFLTVDSAEGGARCINICQVNYFSVEDWQFMEEE